MGMKEEIIAELKEELLVTEGDKFNETLLRSKVNSAYRDVKAARKIPDGWSEAKVDAEMTKFYSNVHGLSLYRYNKVGAEGQTQYNQDGVSVHYEDESIYFYGVIPYATRVG